MISGQFRLGAPWQFAIDLPVGDPSLIADVTVGVVAVAKENALSIPAGGPLFQVTGLAYEAAGDEPAGWAFEVTAEDQEGLAAGLFAMDAKVTTLAGDVSFSPAPVFVLLSNAAVA